jgi:SNF2 family DNA or RNA helicase
MVTDADEPVELCDRTNPRLDVTIAHLERLPHQSIVWARFIHDIDQLCDALGDRACRYDGTIGEDACERSKQEFNAGDRQFFIGNPQKGGRGLTINAAKTVNYYSNSFKLRDRLQSEDRAHRIGQGGAEHHGHGFGVLYTDILATDTVDNKLVSSLREKFNVAAELTGDRLRSWI